MRKLLGFLCVCALAIVTARAQDAVDDYVSSAAGQSVIYHGKEQLKSFLVLEGIYRCILQSQITQTDFIMQQIIHRIHHYHTLLERNQ